MTDTNVDLLKLDMKITAKRMKLKDKNMNHSPVTSKIPRSANKLQTYTIPTVPAIKEASTKENKKSAKKTSNVRKKQAFVRRPVSYNWNRGGRLKEIRIRTQARKFLYLWIQKTFGRMNFSEARSYYQAFIIRKCFIAWKDEWWENCGEMKMWIRAEYFDRYRIYSKVWIAWKVFKEQQKPKKRQEKIATNHYSTCAYKRHIKLWKLYIQLRRMKKSMYNKAYSICHASLTKKTWIKWRETQELKHITAHNNEVATLHWAVAVQRNTWNTWLSRFKESVEIKRCNNRAQQHYWLVAKRRYFSCWCQYVVERRRKNVLYNTANKLYQLSLKHRMVITWWTRYEQLMQHQAKMEACYVLSVKSTKRRYFLLWTSYIDEVYCIRRQQAIADIHYRKCLMKKSIVSMKLSLVLRNRKSRMMYMAVHFYANSLIRNAWSRWQKRMEILEEIQIRDLTQISREHYTYSVMRKAFSAITLYRDWKCHKRKNIIKAEAHFIVKALPYCFSKWRTFVDQVKGINQMKRDAANFRSEVLSTKYFYIWYSNFEQARENRQMDRMAVLQYAESTLGRHFNIWLQKTKAILASNRSDAVARVHYRKTLLRFALKSWKSFTRNELLKNKKWDHAMSYYRSSTLAGAWLSWRQYIKRCHDKQQQIALAKQHHCNCLLKKSVRSWVNYHHQVKLVQAKADHKFAMKMRGILKRALHAWRQTSVDSISRRKANEIANHHWVLHAQSTVFKNWREWAVVHYYKKQQTLEKVDRAKDILNRFKLRRLFQNWKKNKVVARTERHQLTQAANHYRSRVCKVIFQAWQLYRYISLKKALMKRQVSVFSNARISRNYLSKWKTALHDKYDEESKTGDALWHWAMTLQGRCFDGWRKYISESKRKNVRYDQAVDARRARMVKEGCIKMLRYHSDMLAQRTKLAAFHQAQTRFTAYHLAWKYGKRWITKVRERMKLRVQSPVEGFREPDWSPPDVKLTSRSKPWLPEPSFYAGLGEPFKSRSVISLDPNDVTPKQRPAPRCPEFLDDFLQRDGLLDFYSSHRSVSRQTEATSTTPPNVHSAVVTEPPSPTLSSPACQTVSTSHPTSPLLTRSSTADAYKASVEVPNQRVPQTEYSPPSAIRSDVLLLPPSAFALPSGKVSSPQTHAPREQSYLLHADVNHRGGEVNCYEEEERKDTFKTFVASPSQDRDELTRIYAKLQEFQEMKHRLKVLKEQKQVLERWIEENISTLQPNSSLDMVAVQEEIDEINKERQEISTELLLRKPEIENLAVRVKVLSARPTH